ncbi:MAG: hypothetical protein RL748_4375 [Pseudomonadota bacterium]|jgi:hypothetical protein
MKQKNNKLTLTLKKTTLRVLNDAELALVGGAGSEEEVLYTVDTSDTSGATTEDPRVEPIEFTSCISIWYLTTRTTTNASATNRPR